MSQSNSNSAPSVEIAIRIPGTWRTPHELIERLPNGYSMEAKGLVLPDGTQVECWTLPPDGQFSRVFATSCRQPPTKEERRAIENYSANVILAGPGGSRESAYTMMQAAGAIIDAGGAGVFIDNSAMSHGGQGWKRMVDDASPDALSFAFVAIIRGKHGLRTIGMHVLGFPDFELPSNGAMAEEERMISVIRYACSSDKPIGPGHIIADETGPKFHTVDAGRAEFHSKHPMFNPFGYLKLVNVKDIAENN